MFWEVIDPSFNPDSSLVEIEGQAFWQAETRQHTSIENLAWNMIGIMGVTWTAVRETGGL